MAGGDYQSFAAIDFLTADNVDYADDSFYPKVTGDIANPYDYEVSNVMVCALVFDDAGEIIGGGSSYLDSIAAGGSEPAEGGVTSSETPASSELYASLYTLDDYAP